MSVSIKPLPCFKMFWPSDNRTNNTITGLKKVEAQVIERVQAYILYIYFVNSILLSL